MKQFFSFTFLLFSVQIFAQNLPPVITNVQTTVTDAVLTLSYDLTDAEGDPVTVSLRAGITGSLELDLATGNATGDLGAGILPGPGKQIQWDFSAVAASAPSVRLQLVADDLQPADIQAIVDQVDSARLYGDLVFLEGVRHRTAGLAHLQETKDLIENQFLDNNLETSLQSFQFGSYGAANVLGQQTGTETETTAYILCGHFDSVDDSPGADDNASAVAGMLEAMRVLSGYSFKKTIRYIGFDLEESGLVGSTRYVQQGILPVESIAGVLDFEMIGYYSNAENSQTFPAGFNLLFPGVYNEVAAEGFRGNFITNVSEVNNSVPLMSAYTNAAATYVPELSVKDVTAPPNWQTLTPDLGRSDHAPFWLAGIPALMLTDGANFRNPFYHTPNDSLGTLNFTFMTNVVKAAVATLAELGEIQHATTWWGDVGTVVSTLEASGCDFNISPNPSDGMLRLEWGDCNTGPVDVQLTDLQGRVRFSKRITVQPKGYFNLDISGVEQGVYFLKAGDRKVEKIVLN